jgi:tRNA1(Val) A37 N6-methylase TrmN6
LRRHIAIPVDARILDLGSGTGFFGLCLSLLMGSPVTLIELHPARHDAAVKLVEALSMPDAFPLHATVPRLPVLGSFKDAEQVPHYATADLIVSLPGYSNLDH